MREIKFRGKRLDNGELVYGNLHVGNSCWITQLSKNESLGLAPFRPIEVDPVTVGQCSEYLKDINKKCFYEGDIVCMANYPRRIPYLYEVVLTDDGFMLRSLKTYEDGKYARRISQFTENLIIIGNRWDNPDLLEL